MLEHLCWEGAHGCTFYEASWLMLEEFVRVRNKARLVSLGLGALVSGTDDVP
jgi:hypothetical protein